MNFQNACIVHLTYHVVLEFPSSPGEVKSPLILGWPYPQNINELKSLKETYPVPWVRLSTR
ncbi:hypothetical protein D3C81_2233000 [compost metagenome]